MNDNEIALNEMRKMGYVFCDVWDNGELVFEDMNDKSMAYTQYRVFLSWNDLIKYVKQIGK